MTDIYEPRRSACPSCGGSIRREISSTRDAHYGMAGDWNWDACEHCGLWFVNPAPTEAFLYSDGYDDDTYYAYQPFDEEESLVRKALRTVLRYDSRATGDPFFAKQGVMLDIGCGSGEFLYRWRKLGWDVHGLEPSAAAARTGRDHYGLDIVDSWEAAEKHPDESFDYIRLNHSFEHILRPDEALSFVARKLKHDGRLFIGVPNVDSVPRRVFGAHWWNLGAPLHPYGWSARSLTHVLERNGFMVERWKTNSNFSGLLGSVQIRYNARKGIHQDTGSLLSNPVLKILFNTAAKVTDVFKQGDCLEVIAKKAPA